MKNKTFENVEVHISIRRDYKNYDWYCFRDFNDFEKWLSKDAFFGKRVKIYNQTTFKSLATKLLKSTVSKVEFVKDGRTHVFTKNNYYTKAND